MSKLSRKQVPWIKRKSSVIALRRPTKERTASQSAKKKERSVDQVLRCRHEIKYLISKSKAHSITQFVRSHLPLDRYSKIQPDKAYPISSLYLDSPNLQLCRESLNSQKNRFKLRIRSYSDDPDYPHFFEIKRRVNRIIIKDRARIKHHNISDLFSRGSLPFQDYSKDAEILKQFWLYMNSIHAGPVIKVRYKRMAYEDDSHNRVRLTLDHDLAFKTVSTVDLSLDGSGWRRYIDGVVLEIKFTGCYPAWVGRMIKCFDLRQRSISKYAKAVKKSCLLMFCAPVLPEIRY